MTEKLHVVVHKTTNHILASATGPDEAGTAPDTASLFGESLLIRDPVSGETQITVDDVHLKAEEIDFREDILFTPGRFVIVDGLPEHKEEFGDDGKTLDVTRTEITVTRPVVAPPVEALVFWLQLESDQLNAPITQIINLEKDKFTTTESTVLPPGNYRILMLGPHSRATVIEKNVA